MPNRLFQFDSNAKISPISEKTRSFVLLYSLELNRHLFRTFKIFIQMSLLGQKDIFSLCILGLLPLFFYWKMHEVTSKVKNILFSNRFSKTFFELTGVFTYLYSKLLNKVHLTDKGVNLSDTKQNSGIKRICLGLLTTTLCFLFKLLFKKNHLLTAILLYIKKICYNFQR